MVRMVTYLGQLRSMRTIRLLAECYAAFETASRRDIRKMGLTQPQFDVIATLGNTPGMNFRKLGENTLITKGTLTGVVDRLERSGLVQRTPGKHDRRTAIVTLTAAGEAIFEKYFLPHVTVLDGLFKGFSNADFDAAQALLSRMRDRFQGVRKGRGIKKPLVVQFTDRTALVRRRPRRMPADSPGAPAAQPESGNSD